MTMLRRMISSSSPSRTAPSHWAASSKRRAVSARRWDRAADDGVSGASLSLGACRADVGPTAAPVHLPKACVVTRSGHLRTTVALARPSHHTRAGEGRQRPIRRSQHGRPPQWLREFCSGRPRSAEDRRWPGLVNATTPWINMTPQPGPWPSCTPIATAHAGAALVGFPHDAVRRCRRRHPRAEVRHPGHRLRRARARAAAVDRGAVALGRRAADRPARGTGPRAVHAAPATSGC